MASKSFARTPDWFAVTTILLVVVSACGGVTDHSGSASGARTSPSQIASPSPTSATWQVYADAQYGFSISYPREFTFKKEGGADPARGWLNEYRAVETRFLDAYPPGQVEVGVYTKDADTLSAWVQKHSAASCGLPGNPFFWATANLKPVTAAGRDAVSFDTDPKGCGPSIAVHNIVFFMSNGYIFQLDWYANTTYATTIQGVGQQMLATYKD
jgi:hypothetical protein